MLFTFRSKLLLLFLPLQALLPLSATALDQQPNGPIVLATNVEYKEFVDVFDCDSMLLNTLNRHLDERIELQYYPARRIALAAEMGEVHGLYYTAKLGSAQQMANMVRIKGSLIKEATLLFSGEEIGDSTDFRGRRIAYLPAYRRIVGQVASGYYAPSSVQAQSIGQMVKLLAAGRVDGFFLISRYRLLASQLYRETGRDKLHSETVYDDIRLHLHIDKRYTELIKELELKYQQVQQDPLFQNQRLNVEEC